MFKWEVYCCDTVTVKDSAQPPTHIRELTLLIYADNEQDAIERAENMTTREHYQTLSCEEDTNPEADG